MICMEEKLFLELKNTEKAGTRYVLPKKGKIYIGRDPRCQIHIDDPRLSRRHSEIEIDGKTGAITVRDLNSSNGTYINKKRIIQSGLKIGDVLFLGKIVFVLRAKTFISKKETKKKEVDPSADTKVMEAISDEVIDKEATPRKALKANDLLLPLEDGKDEEKHLLDVIVTSSDTVDFDPLGLPTEELPAYSPSKTKGSSSEEIQRILDSGSLDELKASLGIPKDEKAEQMQPLDALLNGEVKELEADRGSSFDEYIGKKFMSYKVLQVLGDGPIGRVYLTKHEVMEQLYVLKIMGKEIIERPQIFPLFQQQLAQNSNLNHPRIVEVINAGKQGDFYYVLSSYIDGSDLSALVEDNGALDAAESLSMISMCNEALEFAHNKNIFHGGIKPSNLLRNANKEWFVSDFGITALLIRTDMFEEADLDEADLAFDMSFFAPEVVTNKAISALSDIYSLGAVMYFALAGKPAFEADTIAEMQEKIITSEPEPLEIYAPDTPPALCAIIERSMSKDPAVRYQSIAKFAKALNASSQF